MASIATAAAGNTSVGANWVGGVVPGAGDRVVLDHNMTVDADWTVGESLATGSGTFAITWGAATKKLTLAAGVKIRVRGDCKAQGTNSLADVVDMQAGSEWIWDMTAAASPSTTDYFFQGASAATQYTRFVINGTSANPCKMWVDGGRRAYFTRGGFAPAFYLKADYCDFSEIWNSSNVAFDFYLGNTQLAELILRNCYFFNCGTFTSATAVVANAEITIRDCRFVGSRAATPISLPAFTNAGTKNIIGNVFDKAPAFGQGAWIVEDNIFQEAYTSTNGTTWGSDQRNFVGKSTQPNFVLNSSPTGNFYHKSGALTNPHISAWSVTASYTATDCIFAHENSNFVGDAMQPGAPSGARIYNLLRCILLPDEDAENSPGWLHGAGGNANVKIIARHCTYISNPASGGETGIGYGETYAGHDGLVEIYDCLAWSPTAGLACIGIRQAGSVQQTNAAKWNYNAVWNPRAGTDGAGYHSQTAGTIFSGAAPGANDVTLTSDPFVDRFRNLATWDASLGGPGTSAHAIAELAKKNDRSGWNSAYNFADLMAYIEFGFQVTDTSIKDNGSDSITRGARPFYSAATTVTLTEAVANAVAADVSVVLGGLNTGLSAAVANAVAADVGVSQTGGGGTTVTLTGASASAVATTPGVTLGALVTTLTAAVASAVATTPSITLGGLTTVVQAAVASGVGANITVASGVVVPLTPAVGTAIANAVTATLGSVLVTLLPASATTVASGVTVVPGGLTVSLLPAVASAVADAVATGSGVVIVLTSAVASAVANTVTASATVTVPLQAASASAVAGTLATLLGGITVPLQAAVATAVASDVVTVTLVADLTVLLSLLPKFTVALGAGARYQLQVHTLQP